MKIDRFFLLVFLTVGIGAAACGGNKSADSAEDPVSHSTASNDPAPVPAPTEEAPRCNRDLDEATCNQVGGNIGPHGKGQMTFCLCPTGDSGKTCTDGEQCEGDCECEGPEDTQGRCSEWVTRYGCVCKMRNGMPQRICKD